MPWAQWLGYMGYTLALVVPIIVFAPNHSALQLFQSLQFPISVLGELRVAGATEGLAAVRKKQGCPAHVVMYVTACCQKPHNEPGLPLPPRIWGVLS